MFERDDLGLSARRAAETTLALGMERAMLSRLCAADTDALSHARSASDVVLGLGALSRMVRMMVHAGVLAVGAGLVIEQQATGGLMMASAVLSARALAPIDVAIAHWRGFVGARQSWRRLAGAVFGYSEGVQPLQLAAPSARLVVKNLSVVLPGSAKLLLEDVSFTLEKGQVLAVLGHSASGKSSLARAVIGVWPPLTGTIRLDGATIDQWADGSLGRHVGYVAQRAELFDGTIAENVARFDTCARPDTIIAATRAAGIHELILSLPDGYQTQIRPDGHTLSAGQQQRIALARALYGEPFLVVLDEPYSSLDADGEAALSSAIAAVRRRGGIVVIISHHQKALAGADYLLFLSAGRVSQFGPTESFLRQSKRVLTASVQSVGSQ
jgi:ATP-binding cassette subfamily C protein